MMMEFWSDRIPSLAVVVYAILSMVVPLIVYSFNRWLHKYADPPWKREPNKRGENP